ncbi:MAG: ATPase, T2SS/T4P/T4SS family [Planctomycetota bacterium]
MSLSETAKERLEQLRKINIYSELSEADAEVFLNKMEEKHFSAGEIIVEAGDEGDTFYIILEGEFEAFLRHQELDFEKSLWRFGAGKYFGEIALLTGKQRAASIRALTDGRVLTLRREVLYEIIHKSPEVAIALCRGMASYIQQYREQEISIRFARIFDYPFQSEVVHLLPMSISSYFKALPLKRGDGQSLIVAMVDPTDAQARKFIREVLPNYSLEFIAVSEEDYYRYIEKYLGKDSSGFSSEKPVSLIYRTQHTTLHAESSNPSTLLLDTVFIRAISGGASDIHIEPWGQNFQIRFRIDGKMLPSNIPLSFELYEQIISRLKIMAEVDITNKRMPQDGSFHVQYGEREIEVRSSFLPCKGGIKGVFRILDPKTRRLDLHSLILSEPVALLSEELFLNPHGLVLVTGPTGSGKTTTLYSGLAKIWEKGERINIITVEDPIEYQMEFATQVQVNRAIGLDFAQILRNVLRQDPNVILVGEIRDIESASTAVEAALTGHLVLSSLHTHFAIDAIVRLRNLKIEPFLIADALQGIISQRLIPRICSRCSFRVEDEPTLRQKLQNLGILEASDTDVWYRGKGCDACRFEGEIGRAGIYEMIQVDDTFRESIEEGLTRHEMMKVLKPQNFISMTRYARFLLKEGIASPETLIRIFPRKVSLEW